jgi:hypothetical protein
VVVLKAMQPCTKVIGTQRKMCFNVFFFGMAIDAKVHHVCTIGNCVKCHSKICHVIGVIFFSFGALLYILRKVL